MRAGGTRSLIEQRYGPPLAQRGDHVAVYFAKPFAGSDLPPAVDNRFQFFTVTFDEGDLAVSVNRNTAEVADYQTGGKGALRREAERLLRSVP